VSNKTDKYNQNILEYNKLPKYTYTGTTRYKYDLFYIHGRNYEKFEDTEGVIRICISKTNRQCNGHRKRAKEPTTIYKTLHIKLKIE
jgi:hypothetical protein